MNPNNSEIFQLVDKKVIQPLMQNQFEHQSSEKRRDKVSSPIETALKDLSLTEVINRCHQNETMYKILRMDSIYNVEELRDWKTTYNVGSYLSNLKNKIRSDDINNIQILSPQAQRNLEELAQSQISDLNFTQYTHLIQEQITSIELGSFTARLNQIRDRLPPGSQASTLIANEALYLKGMEALVVEMKLATKQLQKKISELEKDAKFDQSTMRETLRALIQQASKATRELKVGGTQLIDTLANRYVNETVGLIDAYVERVINYTTNYVGKCHPISRSYNATVVALCREVVDPFNGFWASIGWCYLFYLPSIALAISLISLYRKSEEYPGPLVDPHQSDELVTGAVRQPGGKKSKRSRGHRRNPSEYLPDSAHHYRAGYSYQADHNRSSLDRFQDVAPRNYGGSMTSSVQAPAPIVAPVATQSVASSANQPPGGPPRYTSNPNVNLDNAEYERPPPYYYPGAATSQAPPALPAPNRP
jgi:prominin 1